MSKEKEKIAAVSWFERSPVGQAVGLFFWPLLTVALVVGTLYFDRVRSYEKMGADLAGLEAEAAGQLFLSSNIRVVSDLEALAANDLLADYPEPATIETSHEVDALFEGLLEKREFYDYIRLLDPDGNELKLVSRSPSSSKGVTASAEGQSPEPECTAGTENDERQDVVTVPPVLTIEYGKSDSGVAATFHSCLRTKASDRGQGNIVQIKARATHVLESVQHSAFGSEGLLFLIDAGQLSQGEDVRKAAGMKLDDTPWPGSLLSRMARQQRGNLFSDGNLYSYVRLHHADGDGSVEKEKDETWFAVLKVSSSYFSRYKNKSIRFLLLLSAALLIPSAVVCLFLAKARLRFRRESALRYREQVEHLADLEEKIKRRTRELDDRNLQLSAEIAERLNAERRLRQSNELLSGMLGSIDGVIYVSDFDTHEILFANDYLNSLFGFDLVGKKCWQFIHSSQDGPCVFCTNHKLLDDDGEPSRPYQWEYQNPFNKKWYAAKDMAIRWSNGKYVKLEIAIDITEQKSLQYFLQEARKQAEIAKGIRSRFVALVAHDLKSPFYSMTQMLKRILERETFSHQVHRQFLENIVNNGHRMLQMIDNLLSMDRFETGVIKLEKNFFNVATMGDEVLRNFSHLAFEKGIKLVNGIPEGTMLYADRYLYFVVLNNLLSNAIKFCERGGLVEIFQPDPKRAMTIAVKDTGKGMSEDFVENLFKADIKTSSKGTKGESGSGLGLIFCKDILEAHHGRIKVESERGIGTVFYVILPECSRLKNKIAQTESASSRLS